MNKSQSVILETLSEIETISAEIHKMSIILQELERKLYTVQKNLYTKTAEPDNEEK